MHVPSDVPACSWLMEEVPVGMNDDSIVLYITVCLLTANVMVGKQETLQKMLRNQTGRAMRQSHGIRTTMRLSILSDTTGR